MFETTTTKWGLTLFKEVILSTKPAKNSPTTEVPQMKKWIFWLIVLVTTAWIATGVLTFNQGWSNTTFIAVTGMGVVVWLLGFCTWWYSKAEQRYSKAEHQRHLDAIAERKKLERRLGERVDAGIAHLKSSLFIETDAAFNEIVRNMKDHGKGN